MKKTSACLLFLIVIVSLASRAWSAESVNATSPKDANQTIYRLRSMSGTTNLSLAVYSDGSAKLIPQSSKTLGDITLETAHTMWGKSRTTAQIQIFALKAEDLSGHNLDVQLEAKFDQFNKLRSYVLRSPFIQHSMWQTINAEAAETTSQTFIDPKGPRKRFGNGMYDAAKVLNRPSTIAK
ncbi:MAG: hypothetical protein JST89_13990 [Cyanobacteria bacterium SZAS-4]|nr:hypothetical protein [Cyanobacteria bacterium SZAS-4]